MSDLIDRQAVQDLLDRVGAMHPYRQIGNMESYFTYNEAWTDAINMADAELNSLPSAQPELIEKTAYIRGFEQGRTQGMIDSQAEKVAQPSLQPICNQLATDTISRQAAMEICRRMVWNGTDDYLPMSANAIENEIRQLPPVKVCETAPSDLISRQEAIYAISKDIMGGLNYERILKELSSAQPDIRGVIDESGRIKFIKQPERKKGKWIYVERKEPQYDIAGVRTWAVVYKCSECGFLHTVIENSGIYDYCPNCGTEMEIKE